MSVYEKDTLLKLQIGQCGYHTAYVYSVNEHKTQLRCCACEEDVTLSTKDLEMIKPETAGKLWRKEGV